jgi:VanZ family protein
MSKKLYWLGWLTLTVLVGLSVIHSVSPISGGAPFGSAFLPCDLITTSSKILSAFKNFAHVRGFLIMTLLLLILVRTNKFWISLSFVLGLSAVTEILQMWSPTRHCRITDVVPNVIGMITACAIYYSILALQKRTKRAGQIP